MQLRADLADVYDVCGAISEQTEFGINSNTLSKDNRAWELWEQTCARLNTSPLRTAEEVREHPERQAFLLSSLMLYASAICIPKSPNRSCIKLLRASR